MSSHSAPLSRELWRSLQAFGVEFAIQNLERKHIVATVSLLDALPPAAAVDHDATIARGLGFTYPGGFRRISVWHRSEVDLLQSYPDLARLFLVHRNGLVREAALAALSGPLPSPFAIASLVQRLNDWAEPVRTAAETVAARVLPLTDAGLIAGTAMALLPRWRAWTRWGRGSPALQVALGRGDVAATFAALLREARTGQAGGILRLALPTDELDPHLLDLATHARLPSVRAVALQALVEGQARWPVGTRREWVDKPYGIARTVKVFNERPVDRPLPAETLIAMGASDRSALVRKVAAEGLVRQRAALPDLPDLIARLRRRETRAVRERLDFVEGERAKASLPPQGAQDVRAAGEAERTRESGF